jgi:hypothetical protein
MSKTFKKFYATLLTVILIFTISVPVVVFALTNSLGSENPSLTATFADADGTVYDGNNLEAGSYTVNINLSGMQAVSIFQLTASYTDDIAINSVSTIADNDSSFSCGAIVNEDNSLVVILASENDENSVIADRTAMVTMDVTVNTAGDFEDYFVVNTDEDLTFIEANYSEGFDDAYVCSENSDSQYANLTYDMSPDLSTTTYNVTGQVTIAEDLEGTKGSSGIIGITASVDVNGVAVTATTDEDGYYTLTGLPEGIYTVTFSGDTTIDRTATLTVSAEKATDGVITVSAVPICICDYVKNGVVDLYDFIKFKQSISGEYNVYCDLVVNNEINFYDSIMFKKFFNSTVDYVDVEL